MDRCYETMTMREKEERRIFFARLECSNYGLYYFQGAEFRESKFNSQTATQIVAPEYIRIYNKIYFLSRIKSLLLKFDFIANFIIPKYLYIPKYFSS